MLFRKAALAGVMAFGVLAAPLAADAQQSARLRKIGFLTPTSPCVSYVYLEVFRRGLRELGYTEGQNIAIECRSAEGKAGRLPDLAREIAHLGPDVIVAADSSAAVAAKKATSAIPIAFANSADPVGVGLVGSIPRPGGNVTGLSLLAVELAGKRLELLKEALPKLSRVALLLYPAYAPDVLAATETQDAARKLGVRVQPREVRAPGEFAHAFSQMIREQADARLVPPSPLTNENRTRMVSLAAKNRLPAMFGLWESVDAGDLMSYGTSLSDNFRRAATYVDKILKGAKPADLPVEEPTRFELVINLKTAKALGLTFPPSILIRADQVIQ